MILLTQVTNDQLVTQLQNGVTLMLLGMGTVLVFLVVLIFVTKGLSSIVKKIEAKRPQVAPVAASSSSSLNAAPKVSADAEIAAAIAAAVAKSRE
jgi:oxaloacetate decarboxylase gamma subunit